MSARNQDAPDQDAPDHPPMDTLLAHLRQGLSPPETEKVRAHLVDCRSCRDLLLEADAFAPERDPEISESSRQAAWARLEARRSSSAERSPVPAAPRVEPSRTLASRRSARGFLAQIAALLVLALGAGLLVTHQFRAQQEILSAQSARLEEQARELAHLDRALEEARRETERAQRLLAERSDEEPPGGSEGTPATPTIETSVSALDLLPGGFSRQSEAERPAVSRAVKFFYVNLHLPSSEEFTEFRLEIKGPDKRSLQKVSDLTRTPLGTVGFLLPTAVLATGINEVILEGLGVGSWQEIERYELEVVEP